MNYFAALWQAILTFFAHLHKTQQAEQSTQQAAKEKAEQKIQTERDKLDEQVRSAPQRNVDDRLNKWMRD